MTDFKTGAGRRIDCVLLIYPPVTFSRQSMKQCHLPLGIAYIAAVLREVAEVRVLDSAVEGYENESQILVQDSSGRKSQTRKFLRYGLSFDEIEKRIAEARPDIVGISCIFSSQFQNTLEVARRAKRVNPEIITVVGGSHPTFLAEQCLYQGSGAIDFIVKGEGEFALRELIEALRQGRGVEDVPGLAWIEEEDSSAVASGKISGRFRESPMRAPYPKLDDIPFPARDLFPLEKYHRISQPMGIVYKQRPFMNLITSRGCPYRCAFCSSTNFWGNKYRTRSPENVLAEMQELKDKYGIREFKFFDDNLTADLARAKKIFQGMIERNLKVSWNTPNGIHIARLDEEMLDLMKKSGCYELTLAVESGDPSVLKYIIHKPTNLAEIKKSAKLLRKKGIGSYGFFIIGFPGETKEQIQRTLDFSRELDLDRISCFIANPLPGTELYQLAMEKGYIDRNYRFDEIDYFEARFTTPEWTREELHRLRRNWFWKYNLGMLFRHPVRFFSRYKTILKRPGLIWEIIKRRVRA